ncbi:MAG TPA: AAA family ATPase [Hanamia sp.]|nr:AAA family ATPase [Hanamia sp.]
MTIKQIRKVRDFGIFKKFDWDGTIPDFNHFNLTYGWNYCGKTTISRIFRCYEIGAKHADYEAATFEIEDTDGNRYSELIFPSKLNIRVFNTDFISDNLKWNEGIEPIFMLGEQNIKLQNDLAAEKINREKAQGKLQKQQEDKKAIADNVYWALSNKASEIKNTLILTTFDKRHFEHKVSAVSKDKTTTLLSQTEIQALVQIYKSTEEKQELTPVIGKVPNIPVLNKEINDLLSTMVTAKVIERLRANPELNEWVKTGKELHKDKTKCEFCGSDLSSDLLENLNKHFSKDYDELLLNLGKKVKETEGQKINLSLPDAANFYTEFQTAYQELKADTEKEVVVLNKTLQRMVEKLESKKTKVFEKTELGAVIDNANVILSGISKINDVIKKHNQKTSEFENQKKAAYEKLIKNYSLEFARTQKYEESQNAIANLSNDIESTKAEILKIDKNITSIEERLSETVKGAEKINEYLSQYFSKEDIKAKVTADNKFQLLRAGHIAKNLSEGEKTAIAFAYFITKLEDKNTTLANSIIYLDDPISSLDSNHLFNTYSFIRTKFYDEQTRTLKCKQLFVSTHNYEFFNLIKDWFIKVKDKYRSFYLVERTTNDTKDESKIIQLPSLLLKFKSEYCYLFSLIYNFKQTPSKDFEQLYNLPNIIRRYLEAFAAFKYLSTRNVDENLDQLIPDTVKCERVRKFIHYHSHSLSTNRIMQFSDMKECTDIVEIVLEAVEAIDKEHYDSLKIELTPLTVTTTTA